MRRSLPVAAISLAAIAWAAPPASAAGDTRAKPGTVVKIKTNESRAAGEEKIYFTITLHDAASVAKVDSLTVKQSVKPYVHYKLDRVFVKSWSTSAGAAPIHYPGGVTVASADVSGDSARDINRVAIIIQFKPGLCQVGKRYPSATMTGGGRTYTFADVTITACDREGPQEKITFVYGTLEK